MPSHSHLMSQLRSALAHLDDPSYLEKHPLAQLVNFPAHAGELSRGQALRRLLRLAIEALDPGPNVSPRSPEGRPYEVVSRHYIAKETIVAVAVELGISERQAYRELRRAMQALLQVVSSLLGQAEGKQVASASQLSTPAAKVREEVERLSGSHVERVDLGQLVGEVVASARHLAGRHGVEIELLDEARGLTVTAKRVMLRQAILNLLSYIIRVHHGPVVKVYLYRQDSHAVARFTFRPGVSADLSQPEQPYAVAAQLSESLGVTWTQTCKPGGSQEIAMDIPLAARATFRVLIVDDHSGVIALFRRYLRQEPYLVYGAQSANEALEMLPRVRPDVVILDVMMPDRDGWELLQALRTHEADRARVIICSVIKDPDLAFALGADGFLHKPVDRGQLLQALEAALSPAT